MAKKSQGFKKLIGAAPIKDIIEGGSYVTLTNGEHVFCIEAIIVDGEPGLSMTTSKVVHHSVPRPIPLPRVRTNK